MKKTRVGGDWAPSRPEGGMKGSLSEKGKKKGKEKIKVDPVRLAQKS